MGKLDAETSRNVEKGPRDVGDQLLQPVLVPHDVAH